VIAIGLVSLGLFFAVGRGQFFAGFWAMLTGFFLFDSARGIISAVQADGHRLVDDVMRLPVTAERDSSIQKFVDGLLPFNRQVAYPVANQKSLYGIILLKDIKEVPRSNWRTALVQDVMKPVTSEMFVETGTPLADARELIRENEVGAVCVVDPDGRLVGFLTR
jgi:CBS domain-containing protein